MPFYCPPQTNHSSRLEVDRLLQYFCHPTYPSWTGSRKLVERLGKQDLWIANGVSNRVMLFFPCKCQLRECSLITGRVFNVDKMLVIRDAVIFWQLKQTNESLKQRGPEQKHTTLIMDISLTEDNKSINFAAVCCMCEQTNVEKRLILSSAMQNLCIVRKA